MNDPAIRVRMWLGILLLGVGFLGHFLAARAIGGSYVAYRDHMFGFVGLTLVSGAVIARLVWYFRRGRQDITLLTLGIVQAAVGLVVYIERFRVHG
jgi:hypothetical protein